ncbi:hypothetical protein P7K49_020698 [Saguinus oedipus]|uniref:Vegetative cell wall protein gp1-like n=1 Tax=Saguinus oedipus TaxID=9490 RepID=A0ABQ9V0Z8_SAGOE|nr:hypothetical protein P7K49_020698 [Saguinus oedipus]
MAGWRGLGTAGGGEGESGSSSASAQGLTHLQLLEAMALVPRQLLLGTHSSSLQKERPGGGRGSSLGPRSGREELSIGWAGGSSPAPSPAPTHPAPAPSPAPTHPAPASPSCSPPLPPPTPSCPPAPAPNHSVLPPAQPLPTQSCPPQLLPPPTTSCPQPPSPPTHSCPQPSPRPHPLSPAPSPAPTHPILSPPAHPPSPIPQSLPTVLPHSPRPPSPAPSPASAHSPACQPCFFTYTVLTPAATHPVLPPRPMCPPSPAPQPSVDPGSSHQVPPPSASGAPFPLDPPRVLQLAPLACPPWPLAHLHPAWCSSRAQPTPSPAPSPVRTETRHPLSVGSTRPEPHTTPCPYQLPVVYVEPALRSLHQPLEPGSGQAHRPLHLLRPVSGGFLVPQAQIPSSESWAQLQTPAECPRGGRKSFPSEPLLPTL